MNINYETLNDGRIAISLSDFEDMMDIIVYDDAKSKGSGEDPLRIYREYRGLTQVQLAQKVSLT